jgi:hypothetical protein
MDNNAWPSCSFSFPCQAVCILVIRNQQVDKWLMSWNVSTLVTGLALQRSTANAIFLRPKLWGVPHSISNFKLQIGIITRCGHTWRLYLCRTEYSLLARIYIFCQHPVTTWQHLYEILKCLSAGSSELAETDRRFWSLGWSCTSPSFGLLVWPVKSKWPVELDCEILLVATNVGVLKQATYFFLKKTKRTVWFGLFSFSSLMIRKMPH